MYRGASRYFFFFSRPARISSTLALVLPSGRSEDYVCIGMACFAALSTNLHEDWPHLSRVQFAKAIPLIGRSEPQITRSFLIAASIMNRYHHLRANDRSARWTDELHLCKNPRPDFWARRQWEHFMVGIIYWSINGEPREWMDSLHVSPKISPRVGLFLQAVNAGERSPESQSNSRGNGVLGLRNLSVKMLLVIFSEL